MSVWQVILKDVTNLTRYTLQDTDTTGYVVGTRCTMIIRELYVGHGNSLNIKNQLKLIVKLSMYMDHR